MFALLAFLADVFRLAVLVLVHCHLVRAHRDEGQRWQHPLLDQVVVQRVEQQVGVRQHHALELAVEQHTVLLAQAEAAGRLAENAAHRVRPYRQGLGVESRTSGDHAKALAQQEQRQAVADLSAGGDLVENAAFVDVDVVDQRQLYGLRGVTTHAVDALVLQRGQAGLQADQEARDQIAAAAFDFAQCLETVLLHFVAARLFGELEQVLLHLV